MAMSRASALFLALAFVCAAAVNENGASSCVNYNDADTCNEAKDGCTWCLGKGVGTGCYPTFTARTLPKRFFTCDKVHLLKTLTMVVAEKIEEVKKIVQINDVKGASFSDCVGEKEPDACNNHKGCTWCIGKGAGTGCYPNDPARLLPKTWFSCDRDPR